MLRNIGFLIATLVCFLSTSPARAQFSAPAAISSAADHASLGVAAIEAERSRREVELAALEGEASEARARLRRRVRTLYRLQRSGLLPLAEGLSGLIAHQSRLHRLKRLVEADLGAVSSFTRRKKVLAESVAQLEADLEEARRHAAVIRGSVLGSGFGPHPAGAGLTFEGALLDSSPAVSPAGSSAPLYTAPEGYGTLRLRDGRTVSGESFVELRGYLDMPIRASAEVREGRREDGIGLELLASSGTTVRAVADGRVAFADEYSGYGKLVILDHGSNYFTVYGGLGAISVAVGSHVMNGATVGSLGLDGPSQGLYFEVRQGTRTLDAASWLGL